MTAAYMPEGSRVALASTATILLVLVLGYLIARSKSTRAGRILAWLLVFLGVTGIECLTTHQPSGFRMLAVIGVLLYSMKAVVAVEAASAGMTPLDPMNWLRFSALWFGMRPTLFGREPHAPRNEASALYWRGATRILIGLALVFLARLVWNTPFAAMSNSHRRLAATILLLPGISLILHFGIFNIVTGFWRYRGVDCRPLFRAPLASKSLTEFWGKRWNLAFSEMTVQGVFRPLRKLVGTRSATTCAFVFSGLLHELAISVPVKTGFGKPLLYFVLQAIAMTLERRWISKSTPILGYEPFARIWTIAWLILPLPLLFHEAFLNGCVWPLVEMNF